MSSDGKPRRYRKASLSDSEIMTILIVFQFGSFRNFKHYYLFFIKQHLKSDFPNAVSYNRFVELQSRVFFQMMFFLNLSAFGRCSCPCGTKSCCVKGASSRPSMTCSKIRLNSCIQDTGRSTTSSWTWWLLWLHIASSTINRRPFKDITSKTPSNLCYFDNSYPELGYLYYFHRLIPLNYE